MDNTMEEDAGAIKKKKIFYGWIVVAAATIIYGLAGGQCITFGVFVKPMAGDLGWSRASITGAFGVYMIVMSLLATLTGYLLDRVGPMVLNIVGGLIMVAGCYCTSLVETTWQFYLTFSVLGGAGFSCVFISLNSTLPRWFTKKKGLALGIFVAGAGVGGVILSPLLQHWIGAYGWRTAFVYLAASLCLIIPAALFLKKDPGQMGLRPDGEEDTSSELGFEINTSSFALSGHSVGEALKTSSFWLFSTVAILMLTGVFMAQINMMPYALERGISPQVAASALGLVCVFKSLGGIIMGGMSDKLGTKRSLQICIIAAGISLLWLIFVKESWMLFLFVIPFGFAYGGSVPQMPKIISELFGIKAMGGIFGIFTTVTVLGPAIGPALGGAIFDRVGSYTPAFMIGVASVVISFFLFFLIKPPKRN